MIIGLMGYARSGKDTVADYLVRHHGFVKMAFADPMREALYRLSPLITIADMTGVPLKTAVDGLGWETVKADSPDVRELLQRMGTEVGREMFGEDFWVDYAMKKAEEHERVVFSDVRFQNEAKVVAKSGVLWRVIRPNVGPVNNHISERDVDAVKADFTILNDSTLEDLNKNIVNGLSKGASLLWHGRID